MQQNSRSIAIIRMMATMTKIHHMLEIPACFCAPDTNTMTVGIFAMYNRIMMVKIALKICKRNFTAQRTRTRTACKRGIC